LSQSSPVRIAPPQSWKRCRPTPASFSMSVQTAVRSYVRRRAIAAYFVPTAQCHVHRCRAIAQERQAPLPVAQDNGRRHKPELTRLAKQHARQPVGVVASSSRHSCRLGRSAIYSRDRLDCGSHLDGNGVHSECKAMRAHSLSLYRPVLPRDDRSSTLTYFEYRLYRFLWVARIGRSYSRWKQNHLVGHRTSMGNIFIATRHARF
jgi:hypothetical protein